jgi:predicted RNA-binding protein associated with RNAse of E/G family
VADELTVRKFTYRGDYVTSWHGKVVERTDEFVLVRATWTRGATPVERLVFEPGDIFLEYYYTGRAYSIWGVYTPDGKILKGWYCNVCVPLDVSETTFDVRDLLLDVLVYPDGSYSILDEDEFAMACKDGLPAELAMLARQAVAEIEAQLARRVKPFDVISPPCPV